MTSQTHSPIRETVPVEAGVVAEITTGRTRSCTLEAHYNMLEQCMSKKRAREKRRARLIKIVSVLLITGTIATAATLYLNSKEAQRRTLDSVDHVSLPLDADRMATQNDEALAQVAMRGEFVVISAKELGIDPDGPVPAEEIAEFNELMCNLNDLGPSSIDRAEALRVRIGQLKGSDLLRVPTD